MLCVYKIKWINLTQPQYICQQTYWWTKISTKSIEILSLFAIRLLGGSISCAPTPLRHSNDDDVLSFHRKQDAGTSFSIRTTWLSQWCLWMLIHCTTSTSVGSDAEQRSVMNVFLQLASSHVILSMSELTVLKLTTLIRSYSVQHSLISTDYNK